MLATYVLFLLSIASLALDIVAQQTPLNSQGQDKYANSKRVAIIGAGIAGASAAYRLQERHQSGLALDITVYDAGSQVGGRVKSVKLYDGAYGSQHVEVGAPTFYSDDECLQTSMDEVGLRRKLEPHYPRKKRVGVWDGQSFVLHREKDLKSTTWRDMVRSTWRYGLSPRRLRDLVAERLAQFQKLYGASQTVNRNIPEALENLGLTAEQIHSAANYLLNSSVSSEYSRDVVQATARAWFAHDLDDLNGLAALVAMNPADTDFIQPVIGGNYILIDRLFKLSGAELHLNTRVTQVKRSDHGTLHLTVTTRDLPDRSSTTEMAEYDAIIIATPLQGAGLDLDMAVHIADALTPYVERHVTHFTSPKLDPLSPSFFNVSTAEEIPDKIFTTRGIASDPGFFSIDSSLAYLPIKGCIPRSENLYRVVTAASLEDSFIAELLGKPQNSSLTDLGVRWIHRQSWHYASPSFSNAALLDNIEISDGVFYTGAGEEVVSSLEMSCRMGQLAANLLYYSRWAPELEP